jgi:cytochrome c biogenesis protein CcmG/thiol:disulfide interchange protein DsbE
MKRLTLLLVAVLALLAVAVPAGALADGDPGSDELVAQNLFFGAGDGISDRQQIQLGHLLYATQALGAPVRVAIIGQKADLGTVTPLWQNPTTYSWYLGEELDLAYAQRLVVVMPNGVAYYWSGHTNGRVDGHGSGVALTVASGSRPAQLIAAATAAVTQLETAAGIPAHKLETAARSPGVIAAAQRAASSDTQAAIASTAAPVAGSEPTATPSATNVSPVIIVLGLIVVLGAVFWVPPVWRARSAVTRFGVAVPGLTLAVCLLAALAVLAIVVHSGATSTVQNADETLAMNPDVATPSSLGDSRKAANFTLTDEAGHRISLSQYRGKAVILSFTDAECQTICPLTTQAMVDARDSLGAAKRDVVLLGVNANWHSNSIQDVATYTQLHGLLGQWHFLTGPVQALDKVWRAYGVAGDISSSSNLIEHTPAIYIIGPNGDVRSEVNTYSSYAAIPQFGQVLAQAVSQVLPSHPTVSTHYPYRLVRGIAPTTQTSLSKVGGGQLTVGTAKHVYLFFDSWDTQSTEIKGEMPLLDGYETYAEAHGLPTLIAVDEGAVEPNPDAVKTFLKGMRLNYPVVVDRTGQLADGYGVQGEPWFVLTVPSAQNSVKDPTATTPWEQEVYTQGWPTVTSLETTIPAALHPTNLSSTSAEVRHDLAGSPPVLVALHRQASQILPGGAIGLLKRLAALRGHPVVVNIWASDCTPCQAESEYLSAESAQYGAKVAFVGVDYGDVSETDARGFLSRHHDYYPSYRIADGSAPSALLPGGVEDTPTTLFFNAKGVLVQTHVGSYQSAQQLGSDIQAFALGTD